MNRDVVLVFADVSNEYLSFRRFFLDLLFLENKGTAILRNDRKREPSDTAAHSIRPVSPKSLLIYCVLMVLWEAGEP
jgi:hypothetical protein